MISRIIFINFLIVVLGACVSNLSNQSGGFDDEIYIEEDVISEKTLTELDVVTESNPVEISVSEKPQRDSYQSSRGYWKRAIRELQTGHEDEARWYLEQALALNPNSKVANKLMDQLNADVSELFGAESSEYIVKPGDSLSKLSKNFLNDALKFYALAKYNGMTNPSKLNAGQKIKIPVSNLSLAESVHEMNASDEEKTAGDFLNDSQQQIQQAHNLMAQSRFPEAIDILFNIPSEAHTEESQNLLVDGLHAQAKYYINEGDFQNAEKLLLKATEIVPDNSAVNIALIDLQERNDINEIYHKALNAAENNRLIEAYELIKKVTAMRPTHKAALNTEQKLKTDLVNHYYRQALMFQRKQELDKSIELWDKLLEIDSSHQNAQLFRAKAVNLKAKLEKLVSRQ